MSGTVALVGLDAFDVDLLLPWAEQGELPVLARLLDQGIAVPTEAPPGVFVGAVWPSVATGVNPGRHGYHCWRQVRVGTYEAEHHRVREQGLGAEPVWAAVGRAGHPIAVLDAPHAWPVPGLPGAQVIDWGGHDSELPPVSEPRELVAGVLERWGPHPSWGNCNAHDRTPEELAQLRDDLCAGAAKRAEVATHLLSLADPDLLACVFAEPHCIGHQAWHVHDPAAPGFDASVTTAVGDVVLDVYRAVDAALGRLLDALGPDARVLVLASHGMGTHTDPTFLFDEVLLRLEAARRFERERRVLQRLTRWQERVPPLRRPVEGLGRRHHDRFFGWCSTATWADRRWFQQPNNEVEAGIRLNLVGREPAGRVAPDEVDAEIDWLTECLHELVGADGRPVVADVLRLADHHDGPLQDQLPDLAVRWHRGVMNDRVSSPRIGEVHHPYEGARSGDHHPRGLLIAAGPGVAPGRVDEVRRVEDVAATIAAVFDLPLDGYDGRPVDEIVGQLSLT